MARICALVLAAGRGSRFDGPVYKILAPVDGVPMVVRVVEAAEGAGLPVFVVVGSHSAQVMDALRHKVAGIVKNPDFEQGMSTSLKAGIAAPGEWDAVLVLLGDMPKVSADLCRKIIAAYAANPDVQAVVPTFEGEAGNPVLIARSLFGEIEKLTGDQGARKILAKARVLHLPVDDEAVRLDIDTVADLKNLSSGLPD